MKRLNYAALMAALIAAHANSVCGMDLEDAETSTAGAGSGAPLTEVILEETEAVAALKATWSSFVELTCIYDLKKAELKAKISTLSIPATLEVKADLATLVILRGNAHPNIQGHFFESILKLREAKVTVKEALEEFPNILTMGLLYLEDTLTKLANIIKAVGIEGAKGYIDRFSRDVNPYEKGGIAPYLSNVLGQMVANARYILDTVIKAVGIERDVDPKAVGIDCDFDPYEKGDIVFHLSNVFEWAGTSARLILDTVINRSWTPAQQRKILSLIANRLHQPHRLSEILAFAGKSYDEIFKTLDGWRMHL